MKDQFNLKKQIERLEELLPDTQPFFTPFPWNSRGGRVEVKNMHGTTSYIVENENGKQHLADDLHTFITGYESLLKLIETARRDHGLNFSVKYTQADKFSVMLDGKHIGLSHKPYFTRNNSVPYGLTTDYIYLFINTVIFTKKEL